jgi:predicted dehydrogenase
MKNVRVAALADSDPASLETARLISPAAVAFDSGQELIYSGRVDAVVIATPAPRHKDLSIAAFEKGLHVYLEKPIAMGLRDAARIVDTWRYSGRVGAIGFNYRFNPLVQKLRESYEPHKRRGVSSFFSVPRPGPKSWRRSRESGGGALFELASHDFDLVRFLAREEIREVSATIESHRSEHDFANIQLITVGGEYCNVMVAFATRFEHKLHASIRDNVLAIDFAASHKVEQVRNNPVRLPTPHRIAHIYRKLRSPMHEPSYEKALQNFVNACGSGQQVSPDLMDGYESLLLIKAAEESAASGKPVMVRN